MVISVLVVDDSSFFRNRITDILNCSDQLKVIGQAEDGVDAIEKAKQLQPDVITMDYEMPKMNGFSALKKILSDRFVPILMFSSLTYEGARITLDALDAGAVDFLPKSIDLYKRYDLTDNQILIDKVISIYRSNVHTRTSDLDKNSSEIRCDNSDNANKASYDIGRDQDASLNPKSEFESKSAYSASEVSGDFSSRSVSHSKQYRLLAIGASTGGPKALLDILKKIPKHFPIPIILIQHMPSSFTKAFADRLNGLVDIDVQEAFDGQTISPGLALLAPGGMQMLIEKGVIKLVEGDSRIKYKPSLDVTFGSAAKYFKGDVLAVVLTGMGFDGREGAKLLKSYNATVWAQNEESCVIYGMPKAIQDAGLAEKVFSLEVMGQRIVDEVMGGSS